MTARATDNLDTLLDRLRWQIAHHQMLADWLHAISTDPFSSEERRAESERCRIDGLLEAWEELSRCKYGEPER